MGEYQAGYYRVLTYARIAVTLLLVLSSTTEVKSAGTPAGTTIVNQASATYRARNGQPMPPVTSNIAAVVVAQLAAVNLTPPFASRVTTLNATVDYPATVTNSGNGTDNLSLAALSSLGLGALTYHDANRNAVLDPNELAAGPISQTGNLPADSSWYTITRVTVPNNPLLNGQTDVLTVTATSTFDPTRNASGIYSTQIASAALSFRKSVSNTVPRGGDRVTYTLAYSNAGGEAATNVIVTDVLDHNLRFVSGSSTPPPVSVVGQTVVWNLGTVAANGSGSITFQVDVVNNAIPGTEVHNTAGIAYNDGPNTVNISSSELNFITVQSGGAPTVDFTPTRSNSAEPGDTVDYAFVVTNNGRLAEGFNLSFTSTRNLMWLVYHDINGNGFIDAGEPVVTTTGLIPGDGGIYALVARTIIGNLAQDNIVDVTTFGVVSTVNPNNARTTTGTTALRIPVMSLAKVANAPDPRPGRDIAYTLTYSNGGGGRAIGFVVTDPIPANTTYVPQSVRLNNVAKTDEADADEVVVANGMISVAIGTVLPAVTGTIEFRVRIN